MGKRTSAFGNQKSEVKFNPEKRREYLSGFKKRKDERRAAAQELMKKEERKVKHEFVMEKKKQIAAVNEQYAAIKAMEL